MPRRPQSDVEPQLRRRAELAIKLANEWLSVMNASQRGLARRLGADQSVLSRFLSQQPGYEPARNRPRILKLLEDIEQVCSHLENVAPVQDSEPFTASNDIDRWEYALIARLRHVRQENDPGRAFTRFPELSVQALHFPGPGRAFNCINASLAASLQFIAEWRSKVCSTALIQETIDRVLALESTALDVLGSLDKLDDATKARHSSRCLSYTGVALGFAGLRLSDESLVAQGVDRQLEAARLPSEPRDGVWHNLLNILNVLLSGESERAREWSLQAAMIGRESRSRCISLALADREYDSLVSFWAEAAPDLLEACWE